MRDKNRIDIICSKLSEAWKKQPDMRLGQLICNITGCGGVLFCIEDDDMLDMINKWSEKTDEYFRKLYDEDESYRKMYDMYFKKQDDNNEEG